MEYRNCWETYSPKQRKELEGLCRSYMDFLNRGKTERECTDRIVSLAEQAGFRELEALGQEGLKPGDKVYSVCMNKSVILYRIGKKPLTEGMNILGAHIDSPRLDVKQNPLYESDGFAYLDTHYYGGIKKYQWVALPLAIHGVVVKTDGTVTEVNVGEDPDDPVFFVSDLLVHLAAEQMKKEAAKVIEGEALDIIIGNKPLIVSQDKKDKKEQSPKEKVKAGILQILKDPGGRFRLRGAGGGARRPGQRGGAGQEHDPGLRAGRSGVRLHLPAGPAGYRGSGENLLLHSGGQGGDRFRGSHGHAVPVL